MSWAEEDWTVGLSGRVLQKVKELQVQHDRLSRETKQKQLQLDNIQTNLEKQTIKYDEVRGELHSVQRELQNVHEEAKTAVSSSECLAQELQTKQAQVCSFEGQLDAARTLNNKLTQEVKRLEAELEKLQNSNRSADTTLFSTPCWNTSSPWEYNGSRKEDEKLGHRDETQSKHIRQQLQFSDAPTTSLPRQQHRSTPHRHPSDQSESFSTPSAVFPWERDDTRPTNRRQSQTSPQTPSTDVITQGQLAVGLCGKEKDNRTERDTVSLSEMKSRVSCLEEELSVKTRTLKSIQIDLVQSKKDVTSREIGLQKARDELSLSHTRITQESERASGAEQRLKQSQDELRCQRQNAESIRLQHQQRTKEMEKQHQKDMLELQKERQWLEKQHQQEVNKLNQELQQARTLHNTLQAQNDKLSLQKQALDKELETLKEKLKWTEGQLLESQRKEAQTQAKLTEALREAEGVAVSLEQSRKRERVLEEEGRRLAEERADALRLLKDLQEQKAAPAPPVQFCPVGQSFSPQPSRALHSRTSTHTKRTTATVRAERKEEEEEEESMDEKRPEISAFYPSDREPGEGIDSEHITAVISSESESLQREGLRRKNEEEGNMRRNKAVECDSSGTQKHSGFDPVLCMPTDPSVGLSEKLEQANAFENLQRTNTMLQSEINDVREELQKRLEDLELQRRAEAEARTRLKQLSCKHSSQAVEKEEMEKEWKTKLESERAETERLRKAVAALETEVKSGKEESKKNEREEQEEEKNKEIEDRESEMIELNMQLKKQLAEVKAQLALEREERQREEEERNQITNMVTDEKKELSTKLSELRAELEELKHSREEDERGGEEKLLITNSPLKYLTLHDDELNSNIVHCHNKLLPSPEQHLLFCQSTNQLNMLVSQATADLIHKEQTVIDPERLPLSDEGPMGQVASESEEYLAGSPLSDQRGELSHLQKCGSTSPDMEEEVNRLHKEKAKETQRAQQSQVKLEVLQTQVTRQTQQLTMAFEKQSQHISGLLAELQEKEGALLSQEEELQRYKLELQAFKAEKEDTKLRNDNQREESSDETSMETTELQPNKKWDCTVISHTTHSVADGDSTTQRDEDQTTTEAETPTPEGDNAFSEQLPVSVDSDTTESYLDSACVMEETESSRYGGRVDVVAELLTLRQENQLLKQRIEGVTMSETRNLALQTDTENQEDPGGQVSLLQNNANEIKREIKITTREEEELEEASCLEINLLEQKVVALQMKIQALSEETQQQTDELTLWRLASQPAPTIDQNSAVRQSQSQQLETDEMTHIPAGTRSQAPTDQVQESNSNVTVIREDELFLSCSSNKLPGRMLFSRLQPSNLPEPKSFLQFKQTAALQEYNQDPDKESEKENIVQWSDTIPSQHKDKRDSELIQMSSEKTGQQVTKGPTKTKTAECPPENQVGKPNTSRTTSEIITTIDSSERSVRTDMKSVSSQTEESLCPRSAPTASELHCAYTQTEEEEEEHELDLVESPPVSLIPSSEGAKSRDKMLFSGSFPIPSDPARLAERIRRNRTQLSAAFDDTEYEPYGLPEVVMRGFADIPSGPSCPYIVRRGLLGTSAVPVPQKDMAQEEETD